eukprot:2740873-Heterocapsa_arctica.AAC.1
MDVPTFKTDHNVVYAKVTVNMRDGKRTGRRGKRRKAIDYSAEEIEKKQLCCYMRGYRMEPTIRPLWKHPIL